MRRTMPLGANARPGAIVSLPQSIAEVVSVTSEQDSPSNLALDEALATLKQERRQKQELEKLLRRCEV